MPKKTFVANDFMDLAENRGAAAATTTNTANDAAIDGKLVFKNNATFINCIPKIYDVLIGNAEDLDVVQFASIQQKFRKITGSLGNYYRDEPNSGAE